MFKSGDTVFHALHGIGVIKSIEERELLGSTCCFTTLYFDRERVEVTLSKSSFAQKVRAPLDAAAARTVLDFLGDWHGPGESVWKKRHKENQESLASGDPWRVCGVAKSLFRLRQKGSLANSDRTHLKLSLDMLAEELSTVLGEAREPMLLRLERACSN